MTMGRQGREPGSVRAGVGPVDGTTRLRRSGSFSDRGSFTERVMARVAEEPTPSPGRVFARSLRRLAVRDAFAALVTAWRLAFEPASPVATSARASAAALFLSVVILFGLGGAFITGGALALMGPDGPAPRELGPAAAPTASPAPAIEPTPSTPPTPSPVATPPATEQEPEERPAAKKEKRETPEPKEREQEKKEKRETPEPKERERDERDEEDEREEDD